MRRIIIALLFLVLSTPSFAGVTNYGKATWNGASVDDDDCTSEQGKFWYDTTDLAFEFCNDNSGTPATLGGSGDITDVGNCATGACAQSSATDATFGNIQATKIGSVSVGDGTFNTIITQAGGTNVLNTVSITNGTIDGAKIGSISPNDATFTDLQVNSKLGVNSANPSGTQAQITTSVSTNKGLIVKGAASQTANLQEWQNSSGTINASVGVAGDATFLGQVEVGSASAVGNVTVGGPNPSTVGFYMRQAGNVRGSVTYNNSSNRLAIVNADNARIDLLSSSIDVTPASGKNFNVVLSTTGDFAVNTNQLYVDTSAGNVGVGYTLPGQKLSVSGGIMASGDATFGSINATKIGNTTAADATFTDITVTGRVADKTRACFTIENLAAADDDKPFWSPRYSITLAQAIGHCAGTCTTAADVTFGHVEIGTTVRNAVTGTVDTESFATGDTPTALSGNTSVEANDVMLFSVVNTPNPETDTYTICLDYTIK